MFSETTQIEDPRKQWRGEQEKMLKDYLSVAQDALRTQKELYHVKEQRLALALDEYVRLNDAYKEKSSSHTSREYHSHPQLRVGWRGDRQSLTPVVKL